ncbi:MAG: YkgJ family cysteine cluster protein [Phycisphaerales bacterium]|jgi:Fe-S-cluster containining protein
MAKTKSDLCGKCTGLCCRYFALPIDTPEDWKDYDDIRWYLCHKDVTIFVEDGDWYLNVKNKCRHLTNGDHKCAIYKNRPRICRGYRTKDCDLTEGEYDYDLHFTNDKQMEEYMKIKFHNNKTEKRKNKSRKRKKK